MQYIGKIDINKIGIYKKKIITDEVILTDERLYNHILIFHKKDYEQFKKYITNIIEDPDFILEDSKHKDTLIYLKEIQEIKMKIRIIIKLALEQDNEHTKNSIITLMKQNDRTWKQSIKNCGKTIWKKQKD